MKSMMKRLFVVLGVVLPVCAAFAGSGGNCEKNAQTLSSSQAVRLVAEYDPEEEDPDYRYDYDSGVAYFKVKISKWSQCTIWIEGGDVADLDLDVGTSWDDEDTYASFEPTEEFSGGKIKASYLVTDGWDEEDPGTATFYVCVYGDVGQTTTLYYQSGIKTFTVTGEEESPKTITTKDSEQSVASKLVTENGEYFFKVKLTAGRKYVFRTSGGTESSPLDIDFIDIENVDMVENEEYDVANNAMYWVTVSTTATYKFYVYGGDTGSSFKLFYKSIPVRKPEKHDYVDLVEASAYTAAVIPGRRNSSNDYYDDVIDESLCRIYLKKGERWAFRTSGSTESIEMDVFDSDGKILAANTTLGAHSLDCGVAFKASADGYYYVGVCDPLLGIPDTPQLTAVTVYGVRCDQVAPADAYDPADDVSGGATKLTAVSGNENSDVVTAAAAFKSADHRLDTGDWYDVFAIAARKGVTYRVRAVVEDEGADLADLSLAARVYTVVSGKETVAKSTGVLLPVGNDETELTFTATDNVIYYVRVSVAEGVGLDFPRYSVMALAQKKDVELGMLQVRTKGAEGKWYLGTDKKYYPNGATVNVVGSQNITFASVSGFATPSVITTDVAAGAAATVVTGVYNDSYDRYQITKNKKKVWVSDDNPDGAVALATTGGKTVSAPRTLWITDPQDLFTFKATAGVFYNFDLVDTTLEGAGDAVYTIEKGGVAVIGPTKEKLGKHVFEPGDYTLKVAHSNDASRIDSSYRIDYSTFNAGSIKFAAATYSAKESDEFVTLKVQRTAKEGVVRVRWATQQGTNEVAALNALPGEEYYPTNGVITWANGDKADKTIKVRLIPDLVATVESDKSFTVCLSGMDPDDLAEDEYSAQISRAVATVRLGEVTKKNAGTVAATSYGDETPFANKKSPVMTVKAGESADIVLTRSGYTALTKVAVKVTAVADKKYKDTAVKGTDFEEFSEIVEWKDGDDDDQTVSIATFSRDDYTLTRQFTVTLTPVTGGACNGWNKPNMTASKVTVKIANDTAVQSFSAYAKEMKAAGVTASAKGTWFKDDDGNLTSAEAASASTTFKVTGPGLFVASPSVSGCGTLTCKVGSGAAFVCEGGEISRIVPLTKTKAGKETTTSVVFTLKDTDGESSVTFDAYESGLPFKWIPFKSIVPVDPISKSAVQTNFAMLAWTDQLKDENILYRVRCDNAMKPVTVLTNVTEELSCEIPAGTLVPSKTWYWTLDFACPTNRMAALDDPSEIEWTPGPTVWNFTTVAKDSTETLVAGDDAFGNDFVDLLENGEEIQLVQGVKADFEIGPATGNSSKSRVLAGSLPPGLTLNGAAGKGTVTGVPTKAGSYTVVLQTALGTSKSPKWASSLTLRFVVNPIGTAVGSFRGTLVEDGSALELGAPRLGNLTFSTTSAGKLTAKATIAGKTYTFSGTGFDEILEYDEGAEGVDKRMESVLTLVQKTTNGKTGSAKKVTGVYTNEMTVVMPDGPVTNLQAMAETVASVNLHMFVPNANGTEVTETDYVCDLYRNNSGSADYKSLVTPYVGYYTAALAADGVLPEDGVPAGHGYLTLKVDSAAKVTVSGMLADGTSVSGSSFGILDGDYNGDPQECVMLVPVYFGSSSYGFGGLLKLVYSDDDLGATTVLAAENALVWNKDGSSATADGEGFALTVVPAGGWYNTVVNLQRYYLNDDFLLDGIGVALYGDTVKLASKKGETVKDLTYSIKRATGLASGTLTYAGTKKIKHYGILPFFRDAASPLDDDVWTAGFFLHKVSKSWTESIPFDIRATDIDRDWSEVEPGE